MPEQDVILQENIKLRHALARLWSTRKYEWSTKYGTSYDLSFFGDPSVIDTLLDTPTHN